jgi:hypothetical protein
MTDSKYTVGRDVDLDHEIVLDSRGNRITEAVAEEMAEHAVSVSRGRPSLDSGISPEVKARVPVELRDRLAARARREHKRQSAVIREALEEYLAS